jgi:Tol biopolymer transport system component
MYIAPNGKFLLLEGGEKGRSDTDIYYACKQSDSNWTMPKRVEKINTRYGEGVPSMTADGKFLLFASDRKSKNENVSNANLYIVKTNNLFGKCRKQLFE